MFADAVISTGGPGKGDGALPPLIIGRSAPLFTGKRSLVYVEVPDRDEPTYVARQVRLGPLTSRHVAVAGIDHEIELSLDSEPDLPDMVVRCSGGVRRLGVDDPGQPAEVEVRVPCPPAERVDLVLGARPSQRAPYGLSLVPTAPSTIREGLA